MFIHATPHLSPCRTRAAAKPCMPIAAACLLRTAAPPCSVACAVQFHAVALLHALRATDRLAISKLVTSLVRGSVRSPLAQCLLVRYVSQARYAAQHLHDVIISGTGVVQITAWQRHAIPLKTLLDNMLSVSSQHRICVLCSLDHNSSAHNCPS